MLTTVLRVAVALTSMAPAPPTGQGSGVAALVLSLPGDPYDGLAREIAEAESLPLVSALDDAADRAPGARLPLHVLWVAAPSRLSDEVMVATGRFLERHPELVIGIITGSTQEDARALWRRAGEARGDRVAYALGTQPGSGMGIPEGLVSDGPRGRTTRALTRSSFLAALTASEYVTFSGHGGSTYLGLSDTARIESDDLPSSLPPVVVATADCNTLRPWVGRPLALAFVDKGAAAYAGFTYSPMSGYLLGQYRDLAYRYSWPGFTVGQIVALQSRGTLKGFAAFPYYFLLGDPRLRLRKTAPYRIVMDHSRAEVRAVTIEGPTDGVLPVRIPGGAGYPFLRIPGVGSVWEGDRFYNAHLQMEDVGADKLVLVVRGTGDSDAVEPLAILLSREPPRHRLLTRSVTDALDHTFLFLPQTGTLPAPAIGLVTLLLVLGWGGRAVRLGTGGARWSRLLVVTLAGAVAFLLLGLYAWARADGVAITSKVVTPSLVDALDFGLVVAAGAYLFQVSRSWKGKAVAVLIGTAPALAPAVFTMTVLWLTNVQMRARLGASVYSYHMAYLSIISTVVWLPVVLVLFWLAARVSASGHGARTIA